jgi:hypothetical protein
MTDELPPLFEGPDPREAGPLWVRGRRRPGPNRWGFDWHAPDLQPRDLGRNNTHDLNRRAYEFFTSTDHLARRRELIKSLARRKKVGTRAAPVRRKQGFFPQEALEERINDIRVDAAAGLFRLLAFCGYVCDFRTGRIVFWNADAPEGGRRWRYLSRAEIADHAGFPLRVDNSLGPDQLRVRAYQCDDRMDDGIAAGLLIRHEERRKVSVEFRVTNLFWIVTGLHKLRASYLKREKDKARKEAAAAHEARQLARRAQFSAPEVAIAIAHLAATATNDTDFHATPRRRSPRERGWDPPDK